MRKKEYSIDKKNKIKVVRTILESIILVVLAVVIIKALFTFTHYVPYAKASSNDEGFIAISYFGVDRNGTDTLISTKNLDAQLKALKDNGYETVTQQDIIDYYKKGKKLPEKSLFLMFEDGRNDTAIFAQKIMEEYNYKATIFTYANEIDGRNPKFLKGDDLNELTKSTFWELGTNGYRLAYINVFDKHKKYLGNMTSEEFVKKSSEINRDYNHYLMDYIRDGDGIPAESYDDMQERFDYDYNKLKQNYIKDVGNVPQLYVLMHSNTEKFGTNDKASEINEKWIKNLFTMNFNREGYSLNTKDSSIYDLTRIQPQAYWSTNHLLMRVKDDVNKNINFVVGDKEKASKFKEEKGKAEFADNKIILTSESQSSGTLKLLKSDNYKNIKLSCELDGNLLGSQGFCLFSDSNQDNCVYVKYCNNIIKIIDKNNGTEKELCSFDLDKDRTEDYDIKDAGKVKLDIRVINNKLSLNANDINIAKDLNIEDKQGAVYLESAWFEYGYSHRNIADDVYDGVYKDLFITDENDNVLYDNRLHGKEKVVYYGGNTLHKIINWFVENL